MTESKSKAPLPVLIQPGPRNSLADVVGLFVGNAVDLNALTGVTCYRIDHCSPPLMTQSGH
jgi:L-aminopeptidase/D-esterase-like protein